MHSEDYDLTGRMLRLIGVFAGLTLILLVLSCRGTFVYSAFSTLTVIRLGSAIITDRSQPATRNVQGEQTHKTTDKVTQQIHKQLTSTLSLA